MASGLGRHVTLIRAVAAVVAAAGLTIGAGLVPAQAAFRPAAPPPVPKMIPAKDVGALRVNKPRPIKAVPGYRPTDMSWPAAAWTSMTFTAGPAPLTAAGQAGQAPLASGGMVVRGAGTPVWAQATIPGAGAAAAGITGVRVHVLGHASALAAGVRGVVFTAQPASGSGGGPVRLGVSYARFAQVSGGNYGLGLGLVALPSCALTTPQRPACQKQRPLDWSNDPADQEVSAPVTLASGSASGPLVLAATTTYSDGGGSAGTYNATSLRASGTWSQGGSTGSFDYSYPLTVPPAASSLVPSLSLDYDSGTVDGQTAATQAQASWVGDGWNLAGGSSFIEQSFVPCQDDPEGSASPAATADECYNGPVITLSQDGASNPLVCPAAFSYTANSTCVASGDSGEVITHHVSSGNGSGTKFTDYWTVTGRDGTTYYYGLNHLPGWASGDKATDSTDSVPVFSAHSGDPCYSSSGFGSSACTMAYRWNLDYVTDLHGNAMAYYYDQDTNAYAENGNTASATSYIRDSHLDHIDYGFTAGNAYTGHAPDEVVFGTGDRCVSGTCDPLNSANAANWPDVPYTQDYCAAQASCQVTAPSFWSTVRLASITTQQWNGSAYAPADSWTLTPSFPATGDGTSPALFLASITRKGADTAAGGSAVTLPAVTFKPVQLANRVNPGNYPSLVRNRIGQITTETGAVISVSYELTNPCNPASYPSPSANTSSCFPVYWQQFTPPTPDWFNKYAVQSVSVSDPTGGSPGIYTSYSYGGAAWHFDDNELVQPKYRSYGQWRGYQDVKTFTGTGTDAKTEAETTYYQGMSDDNNSTAVTLTDSQGGQHADTDQLAGEPLESTVYNFSGGPVDHSTIYSYWVSGAAATRTRTGLPALTANATGTVETWARQAITDGGTTTWRKTETDTSYDTGTSDADFALPLFTFSHGDLTQPSQQTCTSVTYAAANTAENLVGLAAQTETDAAACGGSNPNGASAPGSGQMNALAAPSGLSRPAQVISDTRTFYDDPPVLSGGLAAPSNTTWPQAAPTKGDASVVQKATNYTGGAFTYMTSAATTYDSYGRPTATYDANGNKTTTAYTMANGVTTAQTVTNPLGQATSTSYDPLREIPVSVTDPNGVVTALHYDGLGRLTGVWADNRAVTSSATDVYSYAVSQTAPTMVTTQKLNDEGGYVTSVTLYDALLRVRQTQEPTPQGGSLVTDSIYDSRGWQWKTNTNWWNSSANPGTCPTGTAPCVWTIPDSQVPDQDVTAFDGLGRPVLVTSYDDSTVESTTATAYYGDRVTTVPPSGGTPTSTVTDALGRTTELDQYTSAPTVTSSVANDITTVTISGGTTQATDYSYNTRGELSQIKDASTGDTWTKTYNLLGDVTGTTDPNSGASSMTYDNNGNLATTTDADGHTISYTYDALNRKTGEYDGPSSSSPPIATWVYDNSNNVSGVTDAIGQLTTETSYSGGNAYILQEKGFNVFGESLGETLTLPSAEGALAGNYTITHLYSATTGLLLRDYYPASPGSGALPAETVTHGYETGFDLPGGLGGLAAYGQQVTYNEFSQVAQEVVGSTTNYADVTDTYNPHTGALKDSQTENSAVSSTPFDDTSYTYDPSGDITSETDTRNTGTGPSVAETQCFDYDTLDRLTQAWTATDSCAANPSANNGAAVGDQVAGSAYWTTWSFNALGDRTSETDHSLTGGQNTVTSYTYNGNGTSQPDTLTSISATGPSGTSNASYTYDPDGNTLTRDLPTGNQHLTWTDDGKLATDTTSAGTTSYVYDADGDLLLQKDPGQTTLYLFGGTEQLVLNTATQAITGTRFLSLPGGGEVVRTGLSTYEFEFTDQHGTGVLTLNSSLQTPVWRQYTPYGAPRGTAPTSWPDTNGFLGKPTDANTGLTIIGARQYDPATGRFLSVDPVLAATSPQTLAGYSYAADDPVSASDPTGLCMRFTATDSCDYDPPTGKSTGVGTPDTPAPPQSAPTPCYPTWQGCPGYQAGGSGLGILGAGSAGVLIPLTHPVLREPPPGFPDAELREFGVQTYNRVLQATNEFYSDEPMYGSLFITRVTMEDGVERVLIFASSGYRLPRSLRSTYEDLDAEVYQLAKVATPEEGHAEIAALNYRQIMGDLPADQRISSVEDAFSVRPICGPACSDAATTFVDRPGVTVPEGSYGYLNGQVLQLQASSPEEALGIVSEEYGAFAFGSVEEEGDE
jgi:RHS repeat-associated protein